MQLKNVIIRNTIMFFVMCLFCTPINASIVILNGLTHQIECLEGNTYKGVVEMQNTGITRQEVRLYLNDYGYKAQGEVYYTEPATKERSNANWIDLNSTLIALEPNEKYELFYEVAIPANLDFNGSYWSVLMIEPVDDIAPTDSKEGINVTNIVRYAIQIVTTVKRNEAAAFLEFLKATIKKETEKPFLEIDLENKGDLYHLVAITVELYNAQDGVEAGVLKSQLLSLLPNNSKRFAIDMSSIPPGSYKAVVLADCQDENVFGLNIDVTIDGG